MYISYKYLSLNIDSQIKFGNQLDYLAEFALHGDIEVFKYLAEIIKNSTGIRDYIYNEQTVKSMYLAYLSLTPYYIIKSELEMNKGFADIFLKPLNPYVEYIGLVEFKYINRGKNPPTQKQIDAKIAEAQKQLLDYEKDEIVTNYLKDGLKLQKVVIVYWGWEMVYCEIMDITQ